eukprot:TRINITY_DN8614_c0_g1_i1.p1 TRINITY_DN8614_c0_g1~~TRINITY_DN8614_c0_g1_i1.p1  ORF type:complete len:249 (+),score=12.51 TRINITY_DN8614_c0_g1_i1:71-817(+)
MDTPQNRALVLLAVILLLNFAYFWNNGSDYSINSDVPVLGTPHGHHTSSEQAVASAHFPEFDSGIVLYPGLPEDLVNLVSENSYCKDGGFGNQADCANVDELHKKLTERKTKLELKFQNRTIPSKPSRPLTIWSNKAFWLDYEVMTNLDGTICEYPIQTVFEKGADMYFSLGNPATGRRAVSVGTEPWDSHTSEDHVIVSFDRSADAHGTYWPRNYGRACNYTSSCLLNFDEIDQTYASELRRSRTLR